MQCANTCVFMQYVNTCVCEYVNTYAFMQCVKTCAYMQCVNTWVLRIDQYSKCLVGISKLLAMKSYCLTFSINDQVYFGINHVILLW